jgi:hypothetical protein
MRLYAGLLVLVLVSMAFASEQVWPSKGDTVYISASFKGLVAAAPVAGTKMAYDLPPCAALLITKANSKKLLWITKDPMGGTEELEGPWLPRMHKAKPECVTQHSTDGEPLVLRDKDAFKVVPPDPK